MRVIKIIGATVGTMIILAVSAIWWTARPPRRPSGLSANALYMERGVVPLKLSSTPGDWLDCWLDEVERIDRCKLTDEKGKLEFPDVFIPYKSQSLIPGSDLIFDTRRTGNLWTGS